MTERHEEGKVVGLVRVRLVEHMSDTSQNMFKFIQVKDKKSMEGPRSNGYTIGLRTFSANGVPLVEGPGKPARPRVQRKGMVRLTAWCLFDFPVYH